MVHTMAHVQRSSHIPLITCCLRFRSVTHVFGEVGHTHGPVDQRLSILTSAFGAADVIQSPEEGDSYDGTYLLYYCYFPPISFSGNYTRYI